MNRWKNKSSKSKALVNTTTPWTRISAYLALGLVSLGASWCESPILALLGLPLLLAGLITCMVACVRVGGAELKPHPRLGLLCGVAVLAVIAGGMGWADAAAWHFRALGRGTTVNIPCRLVLPILINTLAASAMAYAIWRSRRCSRMALLPHFLYWLSFGPTSFVVTWIRGLNSAPFSA